MSRESTPLSYRKSAVEGASPIGLVIALYDTLSGDLTRAIAALRVDDIETRCRELNHATLVLGQLEDWIEYPNGGDLAISLKDFYSHVRARILEASITRSAPLLEIQIQLILQVRSTWQQRDLPLPNPLEQAPTPPRTSFSQSA